MFTFYKILHPVQKAKKPKIKKEKPKIQEEKIAASLMPVLIELNKKAETQNTIKEEPQSNL